MAKQKQQSWRTLCASLSKRGEKELFRMLCDERKGAGRPTFMARIYGRFAKVRELRERRELLK